jgi:hypothetical protein
MDPPVGESARRKQPRGARVVDAGQAIVEIARNAEREAVFAVASEHITHAKVGMPVKVWLRAGRRSPLRSVRSDRTTRWRTQCLEGGPHHDGVRFTNERKWRCQNLVLVSPLWKADSAEVM